MRKLLVVTITLLVLLSVGVGLAVVNLNGASERVELTPTLVLGDPEAVRDIAIQCRTRYDRNLFWNTQICFEDTVAQTRTEFSFFAVDQKENQPLMHSGVTLQTILYAGMGNSDEPQQGLAAAYQALYEQTSPGEERNQIVSVHDYYDDYPLTVQLDFPDFFMNADPVDTSKTDLETEILQAMQSFFRIPVLSDEKVEISVSRDFYGTSLGFGMGHIEGDSFGMWTCSVCTEDACYFAFDAHTSEGNLIDTSRIPGGYGIYYLPFGSGEEDVLVTVQSLSMVYALDPEAALLELDITPQHDALLLHTIEDGMYVLTVIELDGMRTLQKLVVMPWGEDNYGWQFYTGEDYLAVFLSQKSLTVLSRTEHGVYTWDYTVPLGDAADAVYNSGKGIAIDYNRQRFAVSGFLYEASLYGESCGIYLAIYNAHGLCYYGEYNSSLDAGNMSLQYADRCRPTDVDSLKLRFEK